MLNINLQQIRFQGKTFLISLVLALNTLFLGAQRIHQPYTFDLYGTTENSIRITCEFKSGLHPLVKPVCHVLLPAGADSVQIDVKKIGIQTSYVSSRILSNQLIDHYQVRKVREYPILSIVLDPHFSLLKKKTNFTTVELEVTFSQGKAAAIQSFKYRSPVWDQIISNLVINPPQKNRAIKNFNNDDGAEYLIITNDTFDPLLEPLKNFRIHQGISTKLVTTQETGTTTDEIENYINNAYYTWNIPPAVIWLVGDDNLLPVPSWNNYCISDNIYADVNSDQLPDIIISRFPVKTQSGVIEFVSRIMNFEINPPDHENYYQHPLAVTSHGNALSVNWMIAEIVNGWYENKLGKLPERQYSGINPPVEWPDVNLYAAFGPEGLGYIPEDPSYLANYVNGNADSINAAINSGAMTIFSSAQGLQTGWTHPEYLVEDLTGLQDAAPSIMISICSFNAHFASGSINCLAEAYLHHLYGGVGAIGATEIIYSMGSGWFTVGLMDGLWNDFYPPYPSSVSEFTYPAAALANAKYFLEVYPGINPNVKNSFYHLFHHLGEPYTVLFDEIPQNLSVEHDDDLPPVQTSFQILADSGATVAVCINDQIAGVEISTGQQLNFTFPPVELQDTLHITVTKHNHRRYDAEIICTDPSRIPENSFIIMHVFPNPVSEQLSLQISENTTPPVQVNISGIDGVCHFNKVLNHLNFENMIYIPVDRLASGIYFLTVKTSAKVEVSKFVVDRK